MPDDIPLNPNMRQKIFRVRLSTLLLAMAAICLFLSWRSWQPDGHAASAIVNAGGEIFYRYQMPTIYESGIISQFVFPNQINFFPSELRYTRDEQTRTASEYFFASKSEERIAAVKISCSQITPEILDLLKSLKHLKIVYLDMPTDSTVESERCFRNVRRQFPERLWPQEMGDTLNAADAR